MNPYESPQSASDISAAEQSDSSRRLAICWTCFFVAALLSLIGPMLCYDSASNVDTAESKGAAAIGIWALLNAPATVAMGIGINRKRQALAGFGLVFMIGSGCAIALFMHYF